MMGVEGGRRLGPRSGSNGGPGERAYPDPLSLSTFARTGVKLIFRMTWYARGNRAALRGRVPRCLGVRSAGHSEAMAHGIRQIFSTTHLERSNIVGFMRLGRLPCLAPTRAAGIYSACQVVFSADSLGDPRSALAYESKRTFHHELSVHTSRYILICSILRLGRRQIRLGSVTLACVKWGELGHTFD